MVFSFSASVGQLLTQAPQETHSDSMKLSICPAVTLGFKTAAIYGQSKRSLDVITSPHTAIADDALRRIEGEIGI